MTDFGKIKSYDTDKGTGMITPEKGGDALSFRKSALQQEKHVPKQDQRYGYDVKKADGGDHFAINMQLQGDDQVREQQGRSQQS